MVVVGGGPTGVESAGAIAELYHSNFVKDYPNLPAKDARILLVEFAPALLGMFKPNIQTYTRKTLEKRGVEVCTGDGVVEVGPTRVQLKAGGEIRAHTLVWGAGMQANPLVKQLAGVELQKGGRVPVGPDLSMPDHPEVFVVGDIAWITDSNTNKVLPQLGLGRAASGRGRRRKHRAPAQGQADRAVHLFRQRHHGRPSGAALPSRSCRPATP